MEDYTKFLGKNCGYTPVFTQVSDEYGAFCSLMVQSLENATDNEIVPRMLGQEMVPFIKRLIGIAIKSEEDIQTVADDAAQFIADQSWQD